MRIPFRQGIVRYQTDNANPSPNPTFLQMENGGAAVSLVVSPDPTILTFAHRDANYLFEESRTVKNAWTNFNDTGDHWLYWDIDYRTGKRTFGFTAHEPIVAATPPSSEIVDQHWYDTASNTMKVYHRNKGFVECLRVFAAKYISGSSIRSYPLGTQVADTSTSYAGSILFDESGRPVYHMDKRRHSRFVTSESNFTTHASSSSAIRPEAMVEFVLCVENVAAYHLISYREDDGVGHASHENRTQPIIGLVTEDLYVGEMGTFITSGYVRNPNWNWTEDAGTRVFCDVAGQLTTSVPQYGSLQEVGKIASSTTVLLDIKPMIILE